MAKTFLEVTQPQAVITSGKSTIVNAGSANAYLTDAEVDVELNKLTNDSKQAVLNAFYRIKPGESRKPVSGTYNLTFDYSFLQCVVVVTE